MTGLPFLAVLALCVSGALCLDGDCPYQPTATERYNYTLDLSDNGEYFLFWKFNASHITFEVHAKTYGYVGFGLSTTGRMFPSDIVTGWVKPDGSAVFTV